MTHPIPIGHGYYWQALSVGQEFVTFGRTLTETDLMNFITVTGMTELMFINVEHKGAIEGRVVPAALTYTLIEGLLVQGMIQGTGMALLEIEKKIIAPVRVGDTVHGHVRITDIRPTSKHGRAVVTSLVTVSNQHGTTVMSYVAKRLLAGDPDQSAPVVNS
jgi:3-hydroxybutyryl-CoA dehydratase